VLTFATYFLLAYFLAGDRYTTPIGGTEAVRLADGSRVVLNTDTSLHVLFSARERKIRLDRGEAFFEDTEDVARPFIVYVGDKRVRAVGTQFDVRRYTSDDVGVVVAQGRVRLTMPQHPNPAGPRSGNIPPLTAALLRAGDVARASKTEIAVRMDTSAGVEQLLSWREGYISFDDTPLSEAVAEFNRYNRRKLVIADQSVAGIKIGGNFRSNNEDAFVALLQAGFAVHAERSGDEVILKSK
jgi:transmembrane sensor